MKKSFFIILSLVSGYLIAQKDIEFGKLTSFEKEFNSYEKDTTAIAVYLSEYGNNYFEIRNRAIYLITEYHAKVKILKEEGMDYADIEIPFYHNDTSSEKINELKAITHNGSREIFLNASDVYEVDVDENWSKKTFTFPEVQIGSILEYSYEVQSPFHFNLSSWDFQSEILKVYTEYNARIPGNWKYNRTLIGEIPLDENESVLEKDCFYIVGYGVADCEILKYSMNEVPAFKDSEKFMLSPRNYRSRLEFELSEYHNLKGFTEKFTKSWKDVDREFKKDQDLGRQLKRKNFLGSHVSESLFSNNDLLERANEIYEFVKEHFSWNNKYGIWRDNNVKNAFEEKRGSAAEINITLINLLNASGLKADMILLGTREKGLPKRNQPVMTDFNYLIAKVDIDGKSYLLDATDKEMPFGMLPYRCLNYYGRVMDFDDESYWFDIVPNQKNKKIVRGQLSFDLDGNKAIGKLSSITLGYEALSERKEFKSKSLDVYLDELENNAEGEFYIIDHDVDNQRSDEKVFMQKFDFEIESVLRENDIYFNPSFVKFFPKNPFLSSERYYPVDFGYPRNYLFNLNIKIPDGYRLKSKPDKKLIALPNEMGSLKFQFVESGSNSISVLFDMKINVAHFKSETYETLKIFFQHAVNVQTQSYIVLEKI